MKDLIFLCDLLESKNTDEKQRGQVLQSKIEDIAEKYRLAGNNGTDITLKENIFLETRDSEVYGFYVYNGWVYLLDDNGSDIDPKNVEISFLEKFIPYVMDENNLDL
jgi:hypothetical protein